MRCEINPCQIHTDIVVHWSTDDCQLIQIISIRNVRHRAVARYVLLILTWVTTNSRLCCFHSVAPRNCPLAAESTKLPLPVAPLHRGTTCRHTTPFSHTLSTLHRGTTCRHTTPFSHTLTIATSNDNHNNTNKLLKINRTEILHCVKPLHLWAAA